MVNIRDALLTLFQQWHCLMREAVNTRNQNLSLHTEYISDVHHRTAAFHDQRMNHEFGQGTNRIAQTRYSVAHT
jgi:hypothetical protein